jgi:hypothetical protein
MLVLMILQIYSVSSQTISTVAGIGVAGYSEDGASALLAEINYPQSVFVDNSSNFYIADTSNNRIREVSSSGVITTVVGTGVAGYYGDGFNALIAELNSPSGVFLDTRGHIFIADSSNNCIREVYSNGAIYTVVGTGYPGYSGDGGPATSALLDYPTGLFVDAGGNIFIVDHANRVVRKVTGGIITTIAGTGISGYSGDGGPATNARIDAVNIFVDTRGNIYLADLYSVIRVVDTYSVINTVAGTGVAGYSGDGGSSLEAQLNEPYGVYVDNNGNIYIADSGNNCVRMVNKDKGIITTIAGDGIGGYSGDGGPANKASLNSPSNIVLDQFGNIYVADFNNNRIRKISAPPPPPSPPPHPPHPSPSPSPPVNNNLAWIVTLGVIVPVALMLGLALLLGLWVKKRNNASDHEKKGEKQVKQEKSKIVNEETKLLS